MFTNDLTDHMIDCIVNMKDYRLSEDPDINKWVSFMYNRKVNNFVKLFIEHKLSYEDYNIIMNKYIRMQKNLFMMRPIILNEKEKSIYRKYG